MSVRPAATALSGPARRCFVCGARDWREGFGARHDLACGHCGVRVERPYDPDACRTACEELLVPGESVLDRALPFAADAYTWRIMASGAGLAAWPMDRADAVDLAYPHSKRHPRMILAAPAPARPRVTLGMIVRASALDGALARIAAWRARLAGVVIACDAPLAPPREHMGALILSRPLAGDFAAQRNAVQAAAPTPWVLQLDDDESPDRALVDGIDAWSAQADAQNVVSIGLRRRNLVDGIWSDLWPDIQYRLNRREVRFRGTVHERPHVAGGWRRSTIALGGTIEHHLVRARVEERSALYEAMQTGAGRPDDEAALLRPFMP